MHHWTVAASTAMVKLKRVVCDKVEGRALAPSCSIMELV